MDAPSFDPAALLPADVATLRAMVRELLARIQHLEVKTSELQAKLDAALKHRFGRRSERRKPAAPPPADKPPPRRDGHGRAALPDHLERREVVHDLAEAEKLCPWCGRPRAGIGEQMAEQIDREPARFFVLRTVRKSYPCRHCDPATVAAGQRPQAAGPEQVGPVAKGLCGPGLLAHVILAGNAGDFRADALARYEGLCGEGRVKHVCCLALARRKFVAAGESGDGRANTAPAFLRRLDAIEREMPPLPAPADDPAVAGQRRQREGQRRRTRQREATPVLADLTVWLDQTRSAALPKSRLGTGVGYASNNRTALSRYVGQGYLAIDNHPSERTLRAVALGRDNRGVLGSEAGGQTAAAVLYSIIGTCKHPGLDPFAYLRDALPRLHALGEEPTAEQLVDWLPDRWWLNRTRHQPSREWNAG